MALEERQFEWLGVKLDKKILLAGVRSDFIKMIYDNPLGVIPDHGNILSGKEAINELNRKGFEPFVPFFKKVVKKYEGIDL